MAGDLADPMLTVWLDVDGAPTGQVRIGKPYPEPGGETWRCEYAISGLSEDFRRYVCGVDALQALVLTLELMPVLLEATREAQDGRLTWCEGGPPWGFPGRLYHLPPAVPPDPDPPQP